MKFQDFSFYEKNHIFIARSEDTIFIFHVWGYWCRMVTNMISQLLSLFLYNFISKFHDIFETGILR